MRSSLVVARLRPASIHPIRLPLVPPLLPLTALRPLVVPPLPPVAARPLRCASTAAAEEEEEEAVAGSAVYVVG